ncbi:MAG TPA: SRPBCC domain-containing protein [Thermomicrobiales bacterium]|jgi:uncharacterized protein YndB with AHSA1/START domain/uncharacterized pyridoxamine 5'-phosphate oxidase family protein|nr:SRPBCC domain-containing protein [Thermomicrobiales bacterium]
MIDMTRGFTLVRMVEATPREVWEAWTAPDVAAQWWHPRGMSTPRESVEIDSRVGGRYTYTMVSDETGERFVTGGIYRELVPFERLVFTWGAPDGDPDETPVIMITLEPAGEHTRMTFDLRGVDGAKGDGFFYRRLGGSARLARGPSGTGPHLTRGTGRRDGTGHPRDGRRTGMEQDRIDDILSGEVACRLLETQMLARLAYIARDGTPRVIPIGFTWDGSSMIMCTATNAAKIRALQANPSVAITIDTNDFPPKVLMIRGNAEVEWVDGIPEEYLRMNDSGYMTPEQRAEWETSVRSLYEDMYRIRVRPTWAKVLDFETTLPSAIEELVARQAERQAL